MDRQTNLIMFRPRRAMMMLKGWRYSFSRWRDYKRLKEKRRIEDEKIKTRRKHNDKICMIYNLGKYAKRSTW